MPDLEQLGIRIRKVDRHLVAILAQRMKLAQQVGEYKKPRNIPIYNQEREEKRLGLVRDWAAERGINPDFVQAILYLIINESCKVQMIGLQQPPPQSAEPSTEDERYAELKRNLLGLTAEVAHTYDNQYDSEFFATKSYLAYENKLIEQQASSLSDWALALDLGCATGRETLRLAQRFQRVTGYDISPEMIKVAESKLESKGISNVGFKISDVEERIPQPDNSVSFALMNMGTASDVRNIQGVCAELARVLKPGGQAFLSFYNRDALLYRWDFIPWQGGLAAEINLQLNCLDVHVRGSVFRVYARPYSAKDLSAILPAELKILEVHTHPTLSPILPHELLEEDLAIAKSIEEIDGKLAETTSGAYLIVLLQRQ